MKLEKQGVARRAVNDLYHHRAIRAGLTEHIEEEIDPLEILEPKPWVHPAVLRESEQSQTMAPIASKGFVLDEPPQDEEEDEGLFSSLTSWLADPYAWVDECLSSSPLEDKRYHPLDPNEEHDEGPLAIAVAFAV
jgi:hypothetical protein